MTLKNCTSTDNSVLRVSLESMASPLIEAVFNSLQGDLVSTQINVIADILHGFAKIYSSQTRYLMKLNLYFFLGK